MLSTYLIGRSLLRKRGEEAAGATGGEGPQPAAGTQTAGAAAAQAGHSHRLAVSLAADDKLGLFRLHLHPHKHADGSGQCSGEPEAAGSAAERHEDAASADGGASAGGASAGPPEPEGSHMAEALQGIGAALEEAAEAAAAAAHGQEEPPQEAGPGTSEPSASQAAPPPLSICIMVAGTRGDVQPFIPIGRALQAYGHRVRLASHACYRDFVQSFGLEFFPLGGDPQVLSEYIVRNRGALPKLSQVPLALQSKEQVCEVLHSTYPACTAPDPEDPLAKPFRAQAIISNPPTYGHIHCAERLGVPLHVVFTMPWTPTAQFPCPLAHIPLPNGVVNRLSYGAIFEVIWSGMLHMINSWRQHELGLEPIRTGNHGALLLHQHKVPFSYIWSEAVVPRPPDWQPWVDVVGYQFLEESSLSAYQPPPALTAFLEAGPPPVYVGFGSLVLDDPAGVTRKVVEAGAAAGVRLLISKGWGGLGEGLDLSCLPDHVFVLEAACPHDWLFPRCAAVVHHGGAGTTAAGLKAGRPTCIIPVFGDQHFWGAAVHRMGLGPAPIQIDSLSVDGLADALRTLQQPEGAAAAAAAADQICTEDGTAAAVRSFHRSLPLDKLLSGERVEWDLAAPQVSNILYEAGAGVVNVVARPAKGGRRGGVVGALKGAGRGLLDLNYRPVKGLALSVEALERMVVRE